MIHRKLAAMLLGTVAALGIAGAASAADLPRKSPPQTFVQPLPIFTWTGFYAGVSGGYAFDSGKSQLTGTPGLLATGLVPTGKEKTLGDGFIIGGTLGYNYQVGQVVFGLEGDLSYVDLGKRVFGGTAPLAVTQSQDMSYFGTVRGRIGYAFDRFLVYGTGGLAFGEAKASTTIAGLGSLWTGSKSDTKLGYTLGAGVEYAFTNNWSAKIEYLYYDLGKQNYTAPLIAGPGAGAGVFGTTRAENTGNIVRAGLNYRF
jgi:outer membrane immunogenic protein